MKYGINSLELAIVNFDVSLIQFTTALQCLNKVLEIAMEEVTNKLGKVQFLKEQPKENI